MTLDLFKAFCIVLRPISRFHFARGSLAGRICVRSNREWYTGPNQFWISASVCIWDSLCNDFQGFNLSYDEGWHIVPPQSVFIFLSKISPPDQTLRTTCKFLILGLLYHDFFFFWKFSIKKFLLYKFIKFFWSKIFFFFLWKQ